MSKVYTERNYKINITENNGNILILFIDKDNNDGIIEITEFDMDMQLYHDIVRTLNDPYYSYIGFNGEDVKSYCTCEVSIGTNKDGLDIIYTEDLNCKGTFFIHLWEPDNYDMEEMLKSCYSDGFILTKEDALDLFVQLKNFI